MDSELKGGLILGLGNPLLDISTVSDETFLQKYGLQCNDACLAEARHQPMYQELVDNYEVEYIAGGAVQNSLRVAQWLLQKPKVCVFMGCVGKDKYADILQSKAQADGVDTHYQYHDKEPTGTCAALITDNGRHRSLCANLAAANHFTPDHLQKPENKQLIEKAKFFYMSGFFLTVCPDAILEVANFALKHDRMFIMNLSAPFICEFYKEEQIHLFPYIDILFGNESEAEAFAKAQGFGTIDLKEIALRIEALPKLGARRRLVVITQGHGPVLLARDGEITTFPVDSIPADKIVDTTGAGDAFVGGFIAQLVMGKSLETCIRCGIWAAAEIIQRSGCSFDGEPQFKED